MLAIIPKAQKSKEILNQEMQLAGKVVDKFIENNQKLLEPALNILNDIKLPYHNADHTRMVMQACVLLWCRENRADIRLISKYEPHPQLKELLIASAYHDIGQKDGAKGHEDRGAQILEDSLKNILPADSVGRMQSYILATKMHMTAEGKFVQVGVDNPLAKIMQDADMFNLGSTDWKTQQAIGDAIFKETAPEEFKQYANSIASTDFAAKLFRDHQYQTASARGLLNGIKSLNLRMLETESMQGFIALGGVSISIKP